MSEAFSASIARIPDSQLLLDEAMRERDTLAPAPDHGWLEQVEAFGIRAFDEIRKVAEQGLEQVESDLLVALAIKLLKLARAHDPDAFSKAALAQHDE